MDFRGIRKSAVSYEKLLDHVELKVRLTNLLLDLGFMILYFIFFVTFVSLQADSEPSFEVTDAVTSVFIRNSFPDDSGQGIYFEDIQSPRDWLSWFDNVALPVILNSTYTSNPPQAVQDYYAVLWQKLVKNSTGSECISAPPFVWNSLFNYQQGTLNGSNSTNYSLPNKTLCYPDYSISVEDTNSSYIQNLPVSFTYYPSSPIQLDPVAGVLASSYPSNGYYSEQITVASFKEWALAESKFITSKTRLIGMSGVKYFPTYNYWAYFGFFLEIFSSGEVSPSYDVFTAPLLYCSSGMNCKESDDTILALASISAIFIIFHLFFIVFRRRFKSIVRIMASTEGVQKTTNQRLFEVILSFFQFWVLMDFAHAALGLITFVYIARTYWAQETFQILSLINLRNLTSSNVGNVLQSTQTYVLMQEIFGIQILLFNVQVFKYFPALPVFRLARNAWDSIYFDIILVFIVYWFAILFYALVGWAQFGYFNFFFRTYENSVPEVIRMILGEPNFQTFGYQPGFAWVYLIIFILLFVYILPALFLSVLIEGFRISYKREEKEEDILESLRNLDCCSRNSSNFIGGLSGTEVSARLKDWKSLRSNQEKSDITWKELKEALIGQSYNKIDVTDEEVDAVFRLVRAEFYKPENQAEVQLNEEELAKKTNSPTEITQEIIRTLFDVKAEEQGLLRTFGATLNDMKRIQDQIDFLIRKTVLAVKNENVSDDYND